MVYFLKIALPLPLKKLFTYKYEADETIDLIGCRALLPFNKRIITGYIVDYSYENDSNNQILSIIELLDDKPIISPKMLELFKWVADYYLASLGETIKAGLPQGLSPESILKVKINENIDINFLNNLKKKAPKRFELLSELREHTDYVSLSFLKKKLNNENISNLIESLKNSGLIDYKQFIGEEVKPITRKAVKINKNIIYDKSILESIFKELDKKAYKQSLLLSHIYLNEVNGNTPILVKELLENTNSNIQSINLLEKKGFIEFYDVEVYRNSSNNYEEMLITKNELEFELNQEQNYCYNRIKESINENKFKVFLLHGITGSGKTLIYLKSIKECLKKGKNVMVLVPEISLTPQLIDRFNISLDEDIAIIHSNLSVGERFDNWRAIKNNFKRVILGVRSGIFSPLENIGLIIIDEEHESSFKQDNPSPRYNARDIAILRASKEQATIILGSATPSLESYYNASIKKYELLEILNRADDAEKPNIELIDLANERRNGNLKGSFSNRLLEAIIENIKKKESVILLQNRRGFATSLECNECGYIPTCIHCSVSMTYHKSKEQLRCHYCGYIIPVYNVCPKCGEPEFNHVGYGTQRIEDELSELLKENNIEANIERLDLDTASKKGAYRKILYRFANNEIDILIGTQMVAKGLDFPNVTLVGVINADLSLMVPDFRAGEKTFQLLTQVAGRSGRVKGKKGTVIIQTRQYYNNIFKSIINQSYKDFYNQELNNRFKAGYPPATRFSSIYFYSKNEEKVHIASMNFKKCLNNMNGILTILGPTIPSIYKIKNEYRRVINIKSNKENDKNSAILRQSILNAYELFKNKYWDSAVNISIDIDSYSSL